MTKPFDVKKIKSAQRVLEVFEFFNKDRQQSTVMEIARAYGYPQSSTSELLSCLVDLGYLYRDRRSRTYKPTARVAALGSWTQPELFRQGRLLPMMDELAERSGSAVMLAGVIGLRVHVFHGCAVRPGESVEPGTSYSLLRSVIGEILLSTRDRLHVCKLVHRLNAESAPEARVRCDDLLAQIEQIRRQGFSFAAPTETEEGMCVVLLPQQGGAERLALAMTVPPGDAAGSEPYVRMLRNSIAAHLGPVLAHRRPDASEDSPMLARQTR